MIYIFLSNKINDEKKTNLHARPKHVLDYKFNLKANTS